MPTNNDILSCYQTLGVRPDTSPKAIKKAYRDLVKKWHPDRFPNDPLKRKEAEEQIKRINVAFEQIQNHRDTLMAQASKPANPARSYKTPAATNPSPQAKPPPRRPPKPHASAARPQFAKRETPRPAPKPTSPQTIKVVSFKPRIILGLVGAAVAGLAISGVLIALFFKPIHSSSTSSDSERAVALSESNFQRNTNARDARIDPQISTVPTSTPVSRDLRTTGPTDLSLTGAAISTPPGAMSPAPLSEIKTGFNANGADSGGSLRNEHQPPTSAAVNLSSVQNLNHDEAAPLISPSLRAKLNAKTERPVQPAAELGETSDAQFNRARRFANGEGVPQDYFEAARLYRLAAEAGHAEAQKSLGFLYAVGKGVPRDQAQADMWFRKAGEKGNVGANFASALLALARTNSVTEPAAPGALSPLSTGSTGEFRSPLLRGLSKVSPPLMNRSAVSPSIPAEPKDPEGRYQLGLKFENADGVRQDFVEAAKWYRLAAEGGHAAAEKKLGLFFASGKGVEQNYVEAEKWLRRAAAQGVAGAGVIKSMISTTNSDDAGDSPRAAK